MADRDYRIESFFNLIEGKTYTEAVTLANREATAAERAALHCRQVRGDCRSVVEYVDSLKEFIVFMRCGGFQNRISIGKYDRLFHSYLDSVA